MITEQITEEQAVWDVREAFQEKLTDGTWCCDEQDAKVFLEKSGGDLGVVLHAIAALASHVSTEKSRGNCGYQPDELIHRLEQSIVPKPIPVVKPERVEKLKQSRKRYGSYKDAIPNLIEAFHNRLPHFLTPDEAREFLRMAGGSIGVTIQGFNNVSGWVKHCTNPPARETVMGRVRTAIVNELDKSQHRPLSCIGQEAKAHILCFPRSG